MCFSLCGAAHLASLRQLDNKFLGLYTVTLNPELGLRSPTVVEAREADRILWVRVFSLIDDQEWSFEQALHELTAVRGDLDVLLQPRPMGGKGGQRQQPSRSTNNRNLKGGTKGVIKTFGKPKGGGKKGKKGQGNGVGVSDKFNDGKCKLGYRCRLSHECRICGGNHPAIKCRDAKTSGKVKH